MKKLTVILTLLISFNASAFVGNNLYTQLIAYAVKGKQQLRQTKVVINASYKMANQYAASRSKVQKEFIITQVLQTIEKNKKYIPSIFKSYVQNKVEEIKKLRTYLKRDWRNSHRKLANELHEDIAEIHGYMNYF